MSLHDQIEAEEVIERYVRKELGEEERRAFEEHLLNCAPCFDQVQEMERFVSGLRHASDAGLLSPSVRPLWTGWLAPAFAVASLALVIGGGAWMLTLRRSLDEVAAQRQALTHELEQTKTEMAALKQRPG